MSAFSAKYFVQQVTFSIVAAAALPFLLTGIANATTTHVKTPAVNLAPDTNWHFRIAPYLWGIHMDGTTQIGKRRAHVDESFSNILHHLDFAGMIWLEADKENFGIYVNSMYAILSDSATDGPLSLNAKSHFGIFAAGISYKVYQHNGFSFIPYAGFRYTLNNNRLTLSIPFFSINAKKNVNWTDPLIGARLLYQFNRPWSATLAGDIGGTNTTTNYSYDITGLIGYHPQTVMTYTTIYFGYRVLDQNYQTGNGKSKYVWDMKIGGPLLGVAFDF